MRLVVADTGPINYLILIHHIDILPQLFEKVFMPAAVRDELTDIEAPSSVREWISNPPVWLEIRPVLTRDVSDAALLRLGEGEKAAITLAISLNASLILMDERQGAAVAKTKGLMITGTLGILDLAAKRGLIDLKEAFDRLKSTSFRYPAEVMEHLLRQQKQKE